MTPSAFPSAVHRAIVERYMGLCTGCGQPSSWGSMNAQHRVARGMGGSSSARLAHPANGLPLCGSGTTGCHGWAEAHPSAALLLGWRLPQGTDPVGVPYWAGVGPWAWTSVTEDGMLVYVHPEDDLTDLDARLAAVAEFKARPM